VKNSSKPIVLCILDGWGIDDTSEHNAISRSSTPFYDYLLKQYPHAKLSTSGMDVGLPIGQMGNSEVGHMNIGSGRIIIQDLVAIDSSIKNKELEYNSILLKLIADLKKSKGKCHLMGLISDGGVHSHIDHIIYLAQILAKNDIELVLHGFLDGRDTAPRSAISYIEKLLKHNIKIATICGRYWAMDRDNRWDRIEKSYNAIISSIGTKSDDFTKSIQENYELDISDEFIEPIIDPTYTGMNDNDAILMANLRSDRVRQILSSFSNNFDKFKRANHPNIINAVGMVEYSKELNDFIKPLFPPKEINNNLAQIISDQGLKQLRIAETEKYAHVTFFFNGGREIPYEGEDRILINSPKVKTYDLKPEMSAHEMTDKLIEEINKDKYDFILVNYANADMVGHTGNMEAAICAIETLDSCLEKLITSVKKAEGLVLITADHGNAEKMHDTKSNVSHTSHTTNPVPIILISDDYQNICLSDGRLCDISPTILELMNIKKPQEMTGVSLIGKGIK
jgi:2,3-bisphosphoglycerate-independent phosphoglycerate mutase